MSKAPSPDKKGTNTLESKSKIQKTPISEMMNQTERINKEKTTIQIYEHFTVNPTTINVYTEKPNSQKPIKIKKETTTSDDLSPRDEGDDEIRTKLSSHLYLPKQKFSYPATTTQELGWYNDMAKIDGKHLKKSCIETRYANDYYSMTKSSPYSKLHK